MKKILVTGCAGFIGYHLALKFLKLKNYKVFGIDNMNNYYDTNLKNDRLKILKKNKKFNFFKIDISNKKKLENNFFKFKYDYIFHMAAQAGVRYSILNPDIYFNSNFVGFYNVLECVKKFKIKHLYFASSSSVYGDKKKFPIKEDFRLDNPKSFYAASKICNEIMAKSYCNIYDINATGLRFFTVYGPYGRPDMTPYKFLNNFFLNKRIKVFNMGKHKRDFTFIDDIIEMIFRLFLKTKSKKKSKFDVYNLSKGSSEKLLNYINFLENILGIKFRKELVNKQKGDVEITFGDNKKITKKTKFKPKVKVKDGLNIFYDWYSKYYKIKIK